MDFQSNNFIKNVMKLVSGAAVSQAIIFLTLPILTRFFGPEAFGTAALFSSLVLLISPFSTLSYNQAIVLPDEEAESTNLVYLSAFFVFLTSLVLFFLLFFFSEVILNTLCMPELKPFIIFLPVAIFTRGIYLIFILENSRRKAFGTQAFSKIVQTLTDRIIILGSGFLRCTSAGYIIFGRLFASVTETIILFMNLPTLLRKRRSITYSTLKQAAIKYKNFPMFTNWTLLLSNLTGKLPVFLFAFYFSPKIIGVYALADRLLHTPMQLLGDSIRRVFYQKAADHQNDLNELVSFFESLRELLLAFSFFPFLTLFIISDTVLPFILGPKWSNAGDYIAILGVLVLSQFVTRPFTSIFNVLGKQKTFLKLTFILFITRLVSLIIGGLYGDPKLAMWLLSGSGIITYYFMHFEIGKYLKLSQRKTHFFILKYIVINLPFFYALVLVNRYFENQLIVLSFFVFLLIVYCLLIFLITKRSQQIIKVSSSI